MGRLRRRGQGGEQLIGQHDRHSGLAVADPKPAWSSLLLLRPSETLLVEWVKLLAGAAGFEPANAGTKIQKTQKCSPSQLTESLEN